MNRLTRGAFIVLVVLRYGLDELVLSGFRHPWLKLLTRVLTIGRNLRAPRGERLREALERLGPIFVKFGQVLSTRRDLLPPDIAEELAKLQDRVPPFSSAVAVATIERAFGQSVDQLFENFERVAMKSISRWKKAKSLCAAPMPGAHGRQRALIGCVTRRSTSLCRSVCTKHLIFPMSL